MLTHIQKLCNQKAIRLTPLRKRVLSLIWQANKPIKAYDLLDLLKQSEPNAKPATIYRSLDFLINHNLVHKINKFNAYFVCSHPDDCKECYYLLCQKCEQILECCGSKVSDFMTQQAKEQGFKLSKINLEIEGLCHSCQKKILND